MEERSKGEVFMNNSITYSEANKIAEKCQHLKCFKCQLRDRYRYCDRPLCCGYCPSVDYCESVCSRII